MLPTGHGLYVSAKTKGLPILRFARRKDLRLEGCGFK